MPLGPICLRLRSKARDREKSAETSVGPLEPAKRTRGPRPADLSAAENDRSRSQFGEREHAQARDLENSLEKEECFSPSACAGFFNFPFCPLPLGPAGLWPYPDGAGGTGGLDFGGFALPWSCCCFDGGGESRTSGSAFVFLGAGDNGTGVYLGLDIEWEWEGWEWEEAEARASRRPGFRSGSSSRDR